MRQSKYIVKTPWDSSVFGINTYEIKLVSDRVFRQIAELKGHFTVKIEPLSPKKKVLYRYGFYYCDTLIQPYCHKDSFRFHDLKDGTVGISRKIPLSELLKISHGAFSFGRFHRDFNLDRKLADLRYDKWLIKIYKTKNVFSLMFNKKCIGFLGFTKNRIVLHAISKRYRGRGLSKYLWSAACKELFSKGYREIVSSISASNLAAVNLYSSMGFKFRNPLDVYHKLVT